MCHVCVRPALALAPRRVSSRTCVGSAGDDPGSRRLGGLEQPLPEDALQLGLQLEVGDAAVHRDEQLGQLEPPLLLQQLQDQFRLRIVRHANILKQRVLQMSKKI